MFESRESLRQASYSEERDGIIIGTVWTGVGQ